MYYLVFWNEISFCKSIDKNMKLCVVRLKTSLILVFSFKKKKASEGAPVLFIWKRPLLALLKFVKETVL